MKNIVVLLQLIFISLSAFTQLNPSVKLLHFDDSTLSFLQYYQKDSIGKKFTFVEKESEFRGGSIAWRKYLQNSLDPAMMAKYVKIKKGEKSAAQEAKVIFAIDVSGTPSEIKVTNRDEVHPKLAAEAIRIIQESPRWIPAQQEIFVDEDLKIIEEKIKDKVSKKISLKKAKSYVMQPIVFQVEQE